MGSLTYFGSMKEPVTVVTHCSGKFFNPNGLALSTSIFNLGETLDSILD